MKQTGYLSAMSLILRLSRGSVGSVELRSVKADKAEQSLLAFWEGFKLYHPTHEVFTSGLPLKQTIPQGSKQWRVSVECIDYTDLLLKLWKRITLIKTRMVDQR